MQTVFNFFNQGWVGSLIGIVGAILGVIGIFSYKISKSSAKPAYQKSSLRLIGRDEDNLPNEVTVSFQGKEVDRLTKTTLIIWNNGTEVLDGTNVITSDPISISFNETDNILSYKILKSTKKVNNIQITKNIANTHQLILNFDYLDPEDGFILEILHDSELRTPKITGTIKGIPHGIIDLGNVNFQQKQTKQYSKIRTIFNHPKLIFFVTLLMGISIITFGLLPIEYRQTVDGLFLASNHPLMFIIFGSIYTLVPLIGLLLGRKKYPKALDPVDID